MKGRRKELCSFLWLNTMNKNKKRFGCVKYILTWLYMDVETTTKNIINIPCLPGGSSPAHRSACPVLLPGCEPQSFACSSPRLLCGSPLHPEANKNSFKVLMSVQIPKLLLPSVASYRILIFWNSVFHFQMFLNEILIIIGLKWFWLNSSLID